MTHLNEAHPFRRRILGVLAVGLLVCACGTEPDDAEAVGDNDDNAAANSTDNDGEQSNDNDDPAQNDQNTETNQNQQNDVDIEEYLDEQGIIKLTEGDDGRLYGAAEADDEGRVQFYSEPHDATWELELEDADAEVLTDAEVDFNAGDDDFFALVHDPDNEVLPVVVHEEIPDSAAQMTVDASQGWFDEDELVEYEELDGNPFAQSFTLAGKQISIGIIAKKAATKTAWSVLGDGISAMCEWATPDWMEDAVCWVANQIYSYGPRRAWTRLKQGGARLLFDDVVNYAADELTDWVDDQICSGAGWLFATLTVPGEDGSQDGSDSLHQRLRQVNMKYHFLLNELDEDPDTFDEPAEVRDTVAAGLESLVVLSNATRAGTTETYGPEELDQHPFVATGLDYAADKAQEAADNFADELLDEVKDALKPEIDRLVGWSVAEGEESLGELLLGDGWDCAVAGIEGFVEEMDDGSEENRQLIDYIDTNLELLEQAAHGAYDDLPDADGCTPDLYTHPGWEQAINDPAGDIGSSGFELDGLSIYEGMEDWLAINADPANYNVDVTITESEDTDICAEPTGDMCVELWWYDEAMELAGSGPDQIAGPTCGDLEDGVSVGPVSVGSPMGTSWMYLIPHVYPADDSDEADYHLQMTKW